MSWITRVFGDFDVLEGFTRAEELITGQLNKVVTIDPDEHRGDVGAALNAARADGHFGPDVLLDVTPGEYLCPTPIDWTAQGAGTKIPGPSVDLRGVVIDPDVGAGKHVIEQVGVEEMDVYGGTIEQFNGSGCETALLQARNSAGARNERNNFFGFRIDDPGAGTAGYVNLGSPNGNFFGVQFRALTRAMHLFGTENPDGLSLTHDTIRAYDGTGDALGNTFHGCNLVNHGTAGEIVRWGGKINSTAFTGSTYVYTNQAGTHAFDWRDGNAPAAGVFGLTFENLKPEGITGSVFHTAAGNTTPLRSCEVNLASGSTGALVHLEADQALYNFDVTLSQHSGDIFQLDSAAADVKQSEIYAWRTTNNANLVFGGTGGRIYGNTVHGSNPTDGLGANVTDNGTRWFAKDTDDIILSNGGVTNTLTA